jgi:quercetin dioxygenase-like cupin family protein
MKRKNRGCRKLAPLMLIWLMTTASLLAQSNPQLPRFGPCNPVSERTTEMGCWILVDQPVGAIAEGQISWHLDVYSTRAEAEKAKGARGTVVEALGRVWLLSIEPAGWRPTLRGKRVAEIGPLLVTAGEPYSALFMETVFAPGMNSQIHIHSGPETWYTEAGETCLETPGGKFVEDPGGPPVIVAAGTPMLLTATGTEQRRGLVLILHESGKPPTTAIHDWTPKGLCKVAETGAGAPADKR